MIPGSANPLLLNSAAAPTGAQVSRSLRFNSADSAYLSRTPASAGNRRTFTYSFWLKKAGPSDANGNHFITSATSPGSTNPMFVFRDVSDQFDISNNTSGGANNLRLTTTSVYRDYSAWYNVVLAVDTTQATSSDRVKLYVNGVQVTTFTTATYPAQNTDLDINGAILHNIGREAARSNYYSNFYLAETYLIDGQALTPASFAETDATTGQWIPKAFSGGSYGTNGFYLRFNDNSTTAALGTDSSGNGNTWTTNNLSVTAGAGNDSLVDSPTNYGTDTGVGGEVRGNYCTLNPLNAQLGAGSVSNGNLDFTGPSGSANFNFIGGTFAIDTSSTSGWYFEFTQTTYGNGSMVSLLDTGFQASALSNQGAIGYSGTNSTAGISYANGGEIHNYGSTTTGLTSWTSSGDIISIAIKNNKIWFAKNGTWISGSPSAGTSPSITLGSTKYVTPAAGGINSSVFSLNGGQRAFAYTAPSGYKALCTQNLPAPLVTKSNTVMDVALYTGNGGTQTISGLNFSPDFVWLKSRSNAYGHQLYDIVRGAGYLLGSNSTSAESGPFSDVLTAFTSTGFTVGSDTGINGSGNSVVGWAWDAGTSTVSNTAGSITSQVRANTTAGFSVVNVPGYTYPTKTAGHGLGVEPHFIITKSRGASNPWIIYHKSAGANTYFQFDTGAGYTGVAGVWSGVTSTVFPLNSGVNQQTDIVAYCFAPVVGYSAALSWTGNGSNDGPMIYCGFSPRFWIWKRTDSTGDWWMIDTARSNTGNPVDEWLAANRSDAEYPNDGDFDFLSNGIKIRTTSTSVNASGGSYIGFAWASNPFQYARAQ